MRIGRSASILTILFVAAARAVGAQTSNQASVVFDRYMSPSAGSEDLLTVQSELRTLEDRVLPLKFKDERRRLPLLAGVTYRAGRLMLLDVPQDHMLLVVGHEVFGHGARLRELGAGHISYSFDGPIPYGHGGAVTSFSGELPESPLTFLTISSAGVEAQNVMADAIAENALTRGRLHYREAWLYFENRYLGMTYMLNATEHAREGNDIADFVRSIKDACEAPACRPIRLPDIQRGALLTLGDPMLFYALYGFASSYIGEGKASSAMPMLPVGHGVRVLPSLGFQLTPYGTERIVRTAWATDPARAERTGKFAAVTVRVGHTGSSTPWGIDLRAPGVGLFRSARAGVTVNVWRQPPLLGDHTSEPLKMGAAAAATITLPLRRFTRTDWLRAKLTAGYKAEGFVPGDQLSGGIVIRAGLTTSR